jgi:pyruvate dehydrogenase E1 component
LSHCEKPGERHVQLLGSGTILREVIAAATLLREDWGVTCDVWSAPSFTELARDGMETERWNWLHPKEPARRCYVRECLEGMAGPVVAATDYVRAYADQIHRFVPGPYYVLGTDGFGRSDTRERLRDFFEVDRRWVAAKAIHGLVEAGTMPRRSLEQVIEKYQLHPERPAPFTV